MSISVRRRLWPKALAGKAGIVGLGFILILVVTYVAALQFSSKRLADAWKLSDEFGLPNDLQSILGPEIPPENNMAVALDEASAYAKAYLEDVMRQHKIVDLYDDRNPIIDPAYFAAFEGLRNDANYERLLAEAERRTEYRSLLPIRSPCNIDYSSMQARRSLGDAEAAMARHLCNTGRHDEAVRRIVRLAGITAKWIDKEPFLDAMVRGTGIHIAINKELNRILRSPAKLPSSLHDEIETELAKADRIIDALPVMFQTQKIELLSEYAEVSPFSGSWTLKPLENNDRAYLLQLLHARARGATKTVREADVLDDVLYGELDRMASDPLDRRLYAGTLALKKKSSITTFPHCFYNRVAETRCVRVLNAMARRGDFNADVASLNIPGAGSIDPFDGKTLRVKRTQFGPIIYSVGFDLKDDGGHYQTWLRNGKFDNCLIPTELEQARQKK